MFYLVVGYLFLFIFRPYEYWSILGEYHIERIYMVFLMVCLLLSKQKRYIHHSINKYVILFFFAMVISSMMALNWDMAYDNTYDYLKLLIFYFIIIFAIKDEHEVKWFIMAYLAIMFLYTGKSAWEFFIYGRNEWRMGIARMKGIDTTYGDPNAFAASIAYSLPFLWAMLRCKFEKLWIKKTLLAYGGVALTCIVFTGSRSGMATAFLFFMLAWLGMSKKIVGIIGIGILIVFIWGTMPEKYQMRFMTIVKSDINKSADESALGRTYTLERGIDMFMKYPVLGVGPGNFSNGLKLFGDYSGLSAHNMYGMLIGEMGLIGSLAFIFLLGSIIIAHRRIIQTAKILNTEKTKFYSIISAASIQTLILLIFNGNFGGNLYRYNWLWIGAIGVLSTHFFNKQKTSESEQILFSCKSVEA